MSTEESQRSFTPLFKILGERIRPRTKNVSYHVLQTEKLPLATFPDADNATERAVESILKEEQFESEVVEQQVEEEQIQDDDHHHQHHQNKYVIM